MTPWVTPWVTPWAADVPRRSCGRGEQKTAQGKEWKCRDAAPQLRGLLLRERERDERRMRGAISMHHVQRPRNGARDWEHLGVGGGARGHREPRDRHAGAESAAEAGDGHPPGVQARPVSLRRVQNATRGAPPPRSSLAGRGVPSMGSSSLLRCRGRGASGGIPAEARALMHVAIAKKVDRSLVLPACSVRDDQCGGGRADWTRANAVQRFSKRLERCETTESVTKK